MTCVMGEGEDGVPDTVAHVDVEHPESENCSSMSHLSSKKEE